MANERVDLAALTLRLTRAGSEMCPGSKGVWRLLRSLNRSEAHCRRRSHRGFASVVFRKLGPYFFTILVPALGKLHCQDACLIGETSR